jgi:hypothetical protein
MQLRRREANGFWRACFVGLFGPGRKYDWPRGIKRNNVLSDLTGGVSSDKVRSCAWRKGLRQTAGNALLWVL